MSSCAIRRWGTGSGYCRPQNTEAVREAEARLEAMRAERAKQDAALWGAEQQQETVAQPEAKKTTAPIGKPNAGHM